MVVPALRAWWCGDLEWSASEWMRCAIADCRSRSLRINRVIPKYGHWMHQSHKPIGPEQPSPVPTRHRISNGSAKAASGMAANGDLVHRAAINAIFIEGPERYRQPLGLRWTGPEVAARLSQLVLETNLLAACASPVRIPVPTRHRISDGSAKAASGMATNGD